jgi:hypothetical protein
MSALEPSSPACPDEFELCIDPVAVSPAPSAMEFCLDEVTLVPIVLVKLDFVAKLITVLELTWYPEGVSE